MIDEKDYKLPHDEQPRPRPTGDTKAQKELEHQPWRPFTCEW